MIFCARVVILVNAVAEALQLLAAVLVLGDRERRLARGVCC